MKKNLLAIVLIAAVLSISLVYFYLENTRYYMTVTGNRVYRIDRRSGKMWLVIKDKEVLIDSPESDQKKMSLEEQKKQLEKDAIKFVKYQDTISSVENNERYIKNLLKNKKGLLVVKGWQAHTKDKTAFVSFTWQDSSGLQGYFFEYDMRLQFTRLINGDPDLEKKYGVESLAFHKQKELKALLQRFLEKDKNH